MAERAQGLGSKLVAVLVLLVVAWLLFKLAVGVLAGLLWAAVAVVAVVAAIWALNKIL